MAFSSRTKGLARVFAWLLAHPAFTLSGTRPSIELDAEDMGELLLLLEDFTRANTRYLERHPEVPHPYDTALYYDNEPLGQERWMGVKRLLTLGWGDCEDLAAYLAAWYRARRGIMAKVILQRFTKRGKTWYHAVVALPDGAILDPSKKLGMGSY